jgi:aminoglycoside/choline kinase family phosphotransferase
MTLSKSLRNFIFEYTNDNGFTFLPLKKGFSDRSIFRIISNNTSLIAVESELKVENIAFTEFTKSFRSLNLRVPEILKISDDNSMYLTIDLGEKTLYDFSIENKRERNLLLKFYRKAINDLFIFQTIGDTVIDYKYCYQTNSFNSDLITSDENNFFKYYGQYLPGCDIELFQNSFSILNENLTSVNSEYFMYRDFQPRNIIINNDELYYIDYQSGRKGPLQYDLASFLYSGSIDVTIEERNLLLEHYLDILKKDEIDSGRFLESFNYFTIIRLLQMIGSYAYQIKEKNTTPSYFNGKIKKVIAHLERINDAISEKEIKRMLAQIIFIHI